MRRVAMLSMLMVFFLMIITQPIAADAQLEIIMSDTEVFENEEFSFDARFTNPDTLAYDTFHLYSTGTEELNWGYHMFQGENHPLYTERYTIGLGELGYYTIYVTVFAMFDSGIPEITDSISIHVVERPQSFQFLNDLVTLGIAAVLVLSVGYVLRSRKRKISPTAPPITREPIPLVLIVCPYCGAKNKQGLLKCRKCSAEM